ncbi:MAG: DUF1294 domain-containing protein [Defluviitaleaceae bacterium]|nr:DUF1294 domain-containing protein [Defluviitaleaceae bacterium]
MLYVIVTAAIAAVLWNIITFWLYALDKKRAKNNQWRIKESTLILVAFLMGGLGAMVGMKVLRHKTQHMQFKVLVPIAVVLNIAVIVAVLFFTGVIGG